MKNFIKVIRISLFSILLLMFSGYMITELIDNIKTRSILFILLLVAIVILAVILLKSSICSFPRLIILDFLSLAILIGHLEHPSKKFSPNGVFAELGWAKSFITYGETTVKVTWSEGNIDGGKIEGGCDRGR